MRVASECPLKSAPEVRLGPVKWQLNCTFGRGRKSGRSDLIMVDGEKNRASVSKTFYKKVMCSLVGYIVF